MSFVTSGSRPSCRGSAGHVPGRPLTCAGASVSRLIEDSAGRGSELARRLLRPRARRPRWRARDDLHRCAPPHARRTPPTGQVFLHATGNRRFPLPGAQCGPVRRLSLSAGGGVPVLARAGDARPGGGERGHKDASRGVARVVSDVSVLCPCLVAHPDNSRPNPRRAGSPNERLIHSQDLGESGTLTRCRCRVDPVVAVGDLLGRRRTPRSGRAAKWLKRVGSLLPATFFLPTTPLLGRSSGLV